MAVSIFSVEAGQLATILMMAVALGMDAFSLGIGIGVRGIRYTEIAKISIVIAAFHIMMPLLGMVTGDYVSSVLGEIAVLIGGGLLLLLGGHMLYSSFNGYNRQHVDYTSLGGLLVFALTVSIDSFSVGVSMGLFSTTILFTVMMFGLFGGMMSILGLLLGKTVASGIGEYGEALGGLILFVFGLKILF